MKRYLFMAALAATLAFAPVTVASYAYAEEGYPDVESDAGQDTAQQPDQGQDQGEWITDEPDDMESSDAYDPVTEENQEPAQ